MNESPSSSSVVVVSPPPPRLLLFEKRIYPLFPIKGDTVYLHNVQHMIVLNDDQELCFHKGSTIQRCQCKEILRRTATTTTTATTIGPFTTLVVQDINTIRYGLFCIIQDVVPEIFTLDESIIIFLTPPSTPEVCMEILNNLDLHKLILISEPLFSLVEKIENYRLNRQE